MRVGTRAASCRIRSTAEAGRSEVDARLLCQNLSDPSVTPYAAVLRHRGGEYMATSKGDASKAGKLLATSKSKPVKSVAASDVAQAKPGGKKK